MNESVKKMLARGPGIYAVSDTDFPLHGLYVLVEVAKDGVVHQLTRDVPPRRDGVLSREGWGEDTAVFLYTPGPEEDTFTAIEVEGSDRPTEEFFWPARSPRRVLR